MASISPGRFTTRPEIDGTFGVVASTHWIATAVGMGVLERGGNAFDAGVAAAFTLQIVEPHLNGPGGDVPIIVHDAKRGMPEVICGQGPGTGRGDDRPITGRSASTSFPARAFSPPCIPGTFDAYMLLLRDYGTLRLADVLAPAIGYARNGFPLVERICGHDRAWSRRSSGSIGRPRPPCICRTAGCRRPGRCSEPRPRRHLRAHPDARPRPAAAAGRRQIERARRVWAQGFVAEAIDRFCRTQDVMDVSGRRHRGVLTGEDMAGWEASRRGADRLRLRPLHAC